jgi:hypothetical protein
MGPLRAVISQYIGFAGATLWAVMVTIRFLTPKVKPVLQYVLPIFAVPRIDDSGTKQIQSKSVKVPMIH